MIYSTEVSRGSLLPLESKRIASLLISNPSASEWKQAIEKENILQKETVTTARRQANLIRKRLEQLDLAGWNLIREGGLEVTTQTLLAAAMKHSKLLEDFIQRVYIARQKQMDSHLRLTDWEDFINECAIREPAVEGWNKSTRAKVFNMVTQILVDAKYLVDRETMRISPRSLHPDVKRYLAQRGDLQIINCLERLA